MTPDFHNIESLLEVCLLVLALLGGHLYSTNGMLSKWAVWSLHPLTLPFSNLRMILSS